jgi:hypothetical protein
MAIATPPAGQGAVVPISSAGYSRDIPAEVEVITVKYDPFSTNYMASRLITTNFTVEDAPVIILADCTAGAITVTLPSPGAMEGKVVTIQKIDATANAISIATTFGNVRITASALAKLSTQYGVVDLTAVNIDPQVIWVGR